VAAEHDDAPDAGRTLRALTTPLRALIGLAGSLIASTLRAVGSGSGDNPDGTSPPPLRALPGGATARARRRGYAAPQRSAPHDDDTLATCPLDVGDAAPASDVLLALPRDPRTVFVTWERSPETDERHRQRRSDSLTPVHDALLVEATEEAERAPGTTSWTIVLPPLAESTYVDLGRPRHSVRVTLGTCGDDGTFVRLTSPTELRMPEHEPAAYQEPRWRAAIGAESTDAAPPPVPSRETSDLLLAHTLAHLGPGSGEDPAGHETTAQAPSATGLR
jgi:hypothetical protein